MTDRALPGLSLKGFWAYGENGWNTDMDSNLLTLSALAQCSVLSQTTALPGSPTEGDMYIVPHGAGSHPDQVALFTNGAWVYLAPTIGTVAYIRDTTTFLHWDGIAWSPTPAGATSLSALTDVALDSPGDKQALLWVAGDGKWENWSLGAVALTNNYSDLSGTPSLASVATSGSYADLSGAPSIPVNASFNLAGLGDVVLSGLTTGDFIKWDGTHFVNGAGGGGSSTFAALTDVALTSLTVGDVATWDGTHWINQAPTGGGGTSTVPIFAPPTVAGLAAITNLGGATLADNTTGRKGLYVSPGSSQVDAVVYCALQTISGNFSSVVKVRRHMRPPTGGWKASGIVVRDDTANKNLYLFVNCDSPPTCYLIKADSGFAATSTNAEGNVLAEELFFHIDFDGTHINLGLSVDAVHSELVWQETVSGWGTPSHIGVGWSGAFSSNVGPFHLFEHFFAGTYGANGITYV